jgi:hypothetical protein
LQQDGFAYALVVQRPYARAIAKGLKHWELRGRRPNKSIIGQRVGVYEVVRNTDVLDRAGCCFEDFRSWKPCPGCVIGSVIISEPLPSISVSDAQTLVQFRDKHGVDNVHAFFEASAKKTKTIVPWVLSQPREWDTELPRHWGRLSGQGALRKFQKKP